MNIQNYMGPAVSWVGSHSFRKAISDLLQTRVNVYRGFGIIEVAHNGRSDVFQALWSKQGQDTARNFLMRCIEEILEAADSDDRDHKLEELIDSWFYLLNVVIMDPGLFTPDFLEQMLLESLDDLRAWGEAPQEPVSLRLPVFLMEALSAFLVTLRNRTWQYTVQQPYFTGGDALVGLVQAWLQCYHVYFVSLEEFLSFCRAKHQVLIFRLETNY